jgi:hypothetical protein
MRAYDTEFLCGNVPFRWVWHGARGNPNHCCIKNDSVIRAHSFSDEVRRTYSRTVLSRLHGHVFSFSLTLRTNVNKSVLMPVISILAVNPDLLNIACFFYNFFHRRTFIFQNKSLGKLHQNKLCQSRSVSVSCRL